MWYRLNDSEDCPHIAACFSALQCFMGDEREGNYSDLAGFHEHMMKETHR